MALNAYLRLRGETQGDILGSVQTPGREDSIMVIATSHEVVSPRDAASGLPTGKRQHKPFIITKQIDRSSPGLYWALVNNENITEWTLEFWQPSATNQELQFYTIRLFNASVAGIRHEMLNNKFPEYMQQSEREHVSFVYQSISWTFVDGEVTTHDDWESPTV